MRRAPIARCELPLRARSAMQNAEGVRSPDRCWVVPRRPVQASETTVAPPAAQWLPRSGFDPGSGCRDVEAYCHRG